MSFKSEFSQDSLMYFLGQKCGMTILHHQTLGSVAVTAIYIPDNYLIKSKKMAQDGYSSIVIGASFLKEKSVNKPQREELKKNDCPADISLLKEIRLPFDLSVDSEFSEDKKCFSPSLFLNGVDFMQQDIFVDVSSTSKGKGFQGPMKRHNFKGLRATHGVSVSHRSHGSTGNRKSPSRVFKGKKMAGRMGNELVTMQNLKVVGFDAESSIIFVYGSVPGAKGSSVVIKSAIKKSLPSFNSINGVKFVKN